MVVGTVPASYLLLLLEEEKVRRLLCLSACGGVRCAGWGPRMHGTYLPAACSGVVSVIGLLLNI